MNSYTYNRLTDEELEDFLSRVFVQLEPTLSQQMMSCAQELLEYRSKIANGTLIELPCKVGDTIYTVEYSLAENEWFVKEYTVYGFSVDEDRIILYINYDICVRANEVYYTKAEAEAELVKLQGGNNDNND